MTSELYTIKRRTCVHFTGFEPLSAKIHRLRYMRSARKSGETYGFRARFGDFQDDGPAPNFHISAIGSAWETNTRLFLLDHKSVMDHLGGDSFVRCLAGALAAAWACLWQGAFLRYVWPAPGFALLYVFPFAFVLLSLASLIAVAFLPLIASLDGVHFLWSMPAAALFYRFAVLPISRKLHVRLLLDASRFIHLMTKPDHPVIRAEMERHAAALEKALLEESDELLISTHSMGCVFGLFAVARLLEKDPACFAGRNATLTTIAGNGMIVSLHRNATQLRSAIRCILDCPDINWLDIQCDGDAVQLRRSHIVRGHLHLDGSFAGRREPHRRTSKPKRMVLPEQYRSMRWDLLHKHRQFVLGSQLISDFDFYVLTAGPHGAYAMRLIRPWQKVSVTAA